MSQSFSSNELVALNPHALTVRELRSQLSAHGVSLPTTAQRKIVYVQLFEQLQRQLRADRQSKRMSRTFSRC